MSDIAWLSNSFLLTLDVLGFYVLVVVRIGKVGLFCLYRVFVVVVDLEEAGMPDH